MSTSVNNKRNRHGLFTATVRPQTLEETDRLRGDLPRSRWIERALRMYNASQKEEEGENNDNNDNNSGVRGSESSNKVVPTSTTRHFFSTVAQNTVLLISKEVSER